MSPLRWALGYTDSRDICIFQSDYELVFGIENCFDGIRYLDISPQNSGYGYDISIYRILKYRMIWDMVSRFIAIYHVISRQITRKQQANTISTKPRGLFAVSSCTPANICGSGLFDGCLVYSLGKGDQETNQRRLSTLCVRNRPTIM